MLQESGYNEEKSDWLIKGFTQGFDIHYNGLTERISIAKNLPFTVGNRTEMWNKIMKEVREKRVAGPYDEVPFTHFI